MDTRYSMDQPAFCTGEAYPPIQVEAPNQRYAQTIAADAFSKNSELSAAARYFHGAWVLTLRYHRLGDALRGIAQVELHHLDMLGKLLVLLGGDPNFSTVQNGRRSYWNGGMFPCGGSPIPLLREAISSKQMAIDAYVRQTQSIRDPNVVAILNRILQDEHLHMQILRQFFDEFQALF